MSPVRHSCDTLDVHLHLGLKELPLCRPQPDGRYPQQSKARGVLSSATRGRVLCWRATSSCGVRRAGFARAPACPVSYVRIAPGVSADGAPQTVRAQSPCSRPSCCPGSHAPWVPYAKPPRIRTAGAAPGGVGPHARPRSRPNTAARCRRTRCDAGSTRWAGGGNGPRWSPKMTTRTGSTVWSGGGCLTPTGTRMR